MSWARLLKRVFDIDIEHCPNCGGAVKIIAAIEEPPVMVRILAHLGLPTRAPPRRRADSICSRQPEYLTPLRAGSADGRARPALARTATAPRQ